MDNQPEFTEIQNTPPQKKPNLKILKTVVILTVIAAISGSGTYYVQHKKLEDTQSNLEQEISSLKQQINDTQKIVAIPSPSATPLSTPRPTNTLTITTSPTVTPDPTAAWKTYTSPELGLSFKYSYSDDNWSKPQVSLIDWTNAEKSSVLRGKNYDLTFQNFFLYGYSSDFSSGSSLPNDYVHYLGNISDLNLPEVTTLARDGANNYYFQKNFTITGQKTYYKVVSDETSAQIGCADEISNSGNNACNPYTAIYAYLNGKNAYKGIVIYAKFNSIDSRLANYLATKGATKTGLEQMIMEELNRLKDGTSTDATALTEYQNFKTLLATFSFR